MQCTDDSHSAEISLFTNNNSATLFLSLFPRNRPFHFPLLTNAAIWEHFFSLPGEVLADDRGVEHVDSHQECLKWTCEDQGLELSLSGWMIVVWVLLERGGGCLPSVGGLVSKQLRGRRQVSLRRWGWGRCNLWSHRQEDKELKSRSQL